MHVTCLALRLVQALVPGYRAATEAYWEAVAAVGFRLLRLLGLSLGLGAGACTGRLRRGCSNGTIRLPAHFSG